MVALKITWKLCAEDAAFISDSDAFGLKMGNILLQIQNMKTTRFCLICDIPEPVKQNDREKHSSLKIGDIRREIHVSAARHKREERIWRNKQIAPDENYSGAVSVQVSKPVKL